MHQIHIHVLPNTLVCTDAPYTHTCATKHKCVHRCTKYTYMHHMHQQTHRCTTKHCQNTYLVGLPCALYERPGQNKRFVLNQLFGLLKEILILGDNPKAHKTSCENHCSFHEKHLKSEKHTEKQQKQLIQHRSLILTWHFIQYRGKANYVYLMFWWCLVMTCMFGGACGILCTHLVVCVCAYGACMCS